MKIARHLSIVFVAVVVAGCTVAPGESTPPKSTLVATEIADISGKWTVTLQTPQGITSSTMSVIQTGSAIAGTLDSAMGTVDYTGSVKGNEVKFSYGIEKFGGPAGTIISYVGTTDGVSMKGKATFGSFGGGEWSAKRP